jgi:AraC family transcriptional regulator
MTFEAAMTDTHMDTSEPDVERVPMSSRGLNWSGLKFERRESRRGARDASKGSRHHLIFVGLSNGKVTRECNGERTEHELTPGCVLVIPAHTPTRWTWSSRIAYSVLMLEPEVLDRVADEVFDLPPDRYRLPVVERRNDTAIANIAGVLAREALSRDRAGSLYSESLANILAVHLLRNYACGVDGSALDASAVPDAQGMQAVIGAGNPPRAVSEALEFIQKNSARELGLRDIAQAVNLSSFHLARLFKQTLGVSPYQHVIQVRVNNARSLLAAGSGRHSLADIASAVGFADQSHLTRHFKRITGVTPRQYRG